MNRTLDMIMDRRSIRKFHPEVPSLELVSAAVEAGRYAPSGHNKQLTHLLVITDPAVVKKLGELTAAGMGQPGADLYYSAPVIIVAANRRDNDNSLPDCACVLENILLAAHILGLGGCWINHLRRLDHDPAVRALLEELGLSKDEWVCGSVALGMPAVPNPPRTPRTGNPVTWITGQ